jgi:hypothetical protein
VGGAVICADSELWIYWAGRGALYICEVVYMPNVAVGETEREREMVPGAARIVGHYVNSQHRGQQLI